VNLPGQEEQRPLLHAHLASGVGADGLLAAAGRLVSFGTSVGAGHGGPSPSSTWAGMAVDYTPAGRCVRLARLRRGWPAAARPGETLRIEPGRGLAFAMRP
jgi:diaminopimelate decarboxylase